MRTTVCVTGADERPVPLPAEFRYTMADPYAVRLSLGTPLAPPVEWAFARSLLADGLRRTSGTGDVVVFPRSPGRPDAVRILLIRPKGTAALDVATASVTTLLELADALVPPGTEHDHIDLDYVAEQLTAGLD
ncbi:SsgA family sporulation/cell division regulator [Streptomyces sp. LP11]|uniref:SsgA family sporulation/cell division regulator n=1 Tax=Streptomyces pyxinicus TaxID=2970331 RepID=A0ABT2AV39_9ACTN|nr:SsgA family sporulation/cell division regulator [Streptomyces sp. LP11]MCS0600035.1 SsgA family sporulation/cell division regulator [Streptomyces sp. LP11]